MILLHVFFSIDKYLTDAFIVSNTTQGHCAKTYNILVEASKILKKKKSKLANYQ